MVALDLWGVYLLISTEIKKEKEMAQLDNNLCYPDNIQAIRYRDDGTTTFIDSIGEFYIRDTDHEKVYVHDDIELVNPILNQEYYPNNSEIQPKPYELKRKIDIDE